MKINGVLTGNFYLIKNNIVVGEAVIMSESYVVYHLWESLTYTRTTTVEKLIKKYKLSKNKF